MHNNLAEARCGTIGFSTIENMLPGNPTVQGKRAPANPWFAHFKPRPAARLRLFCLPYAGGDAGIFRQWPNLLPPDIEVCPIEIPGRASRIRETPLRSMESLVSAIVTGIDDYLNKPFAFFGHSMGATASFEVAHRLRTLRGVEPAHLFVSARRAPHLPRLDPPIYNLPQPQLLEELKRLEGTPAELLANEELLELFLPRLRSDFEIIETYEYSVRPRLSCNITAIGGISDKDVSREQLEAWRNESLGSFHLRMLSGNHFFLTSQQNSIAEIIRQRLSDWTSR